MEDNNLDLVCNESSYIRERCDEYLSCLQNIENLLILESIDREEKDIP